MKIIPLFAKGIQKAANHTFSRTGFYLLLLALAFQSCVYVGIGKNPSWKTAANGKAFIAPKSDSSKPEMHVEVLRNQLMVPLPFLVLAVNKKHYALHFWVKPNTDKALRLDSISYQLYGPGKNLISKGNHRLDNRPREIKPAHRLSYENAGHTKYELPIDKTLNENLWVLVALHYKDSTGKATSEAYEQPLQVEVPKQVNVHLLGN